MAMRTDKSKTVTHDETVAPFKSAAMVDLSRIHISDTEKLERCIENASLTEPSTPTHRRIHEVEFNDNNSPLYVKTPGGTQLTRTLTIGCFQFFDNRFKDMSPASNKRIIEEVDEDEDFFTTKAYREKIKKLHKSEKIQEVTVTHQLLAETKRINAANQNRRKVSQNQVMAVSGRSKDGSATQYAASLPIAKATAKEHAHLAAHKFVGPKGQNDKNLAISTNHANTAMMLPEDVVEPLAATHPNGVKISAKSKHVRIASEKENRSDEYLQLATVIEYNLATEEDRFNFEFNAQNEIPVHISFQDYTRSFFAGITADPKKPASAVNMPITFFNSGKKIDAKTALSTPSKSRRAE